MADYRHTTQTIRAYLAAMDRAPTHEMADAARAYAEQCAEANNRLRRCVDYLRLGLLSEAVELAEEQPPLLDMVATLDLPRPDDWEQACTAYGWPRAQRVMMEAAREVNDAYNHLQPLADLLQRHRTLSLRRAPLAERLPVLWELAETDRRSPFWPNDAKNLEAARLLELTTSASAAAREGNLEQIDTLLEEVQDKRWKSPVPEELKTTLQKASGIGHRRTAVARLLAMAPRVEAAVNNANAAEGRRVLDDWCAVVAKSGITLPPELRQLVRPLNALVDQDDERLARERAFRTACADLATALQERVDPIALKEIYHAASNFGLAIPDKIESAYRRRLAAWEQSQREEARRSLILTVLLVGSIVAALAALIVVALRYGR